MAEYDQNAWDGEMPRHAPRHAAPVAGGSDLGATQYVGTSAVRAAPADAAQGSGAPAAGTVPTGGAAWAAPEGDPCAPASASADPYSANGPTAAPARGPYTSRDPYAAPSAPSLDETQCVAQPRYVQSHAAGAQRRAYVESPPQQDPYIPGEDSSGEGGGAVFSRRVNVSPRLVKRVVKVVLALVALIVAFQAITWVMNGGRTVASAGSNAVSKSQLNGGSSGSRGSGSGDSATTTGSSDSAAHDIGSSIGSSVGSVLGGVAGDMAGKLGSVDTSNIADQLGSAADSLGSAASSVAGALGDLVGQLAN